MAIIALTGATFGGNKDDFGTFSVGTTGTYTLTYDLPRREVLPDPINDGLPCDGTGPGAHCHLVGYRNAFVASIPPVPRWRMNFPVGWSFKDHNAVVIVHYVSSVIDDQYAAANPGMKVVLPELSSWTTLDLQYGY